MISINAVVYREADGRFTAEVPACPGCAASGATSEEAVANLREAAALYFEDEPCDRPAGASAAAQMERIAL
jgi:predicted RNase H-like HicB family nuclease